MDTAVKYIDLASDAADMDRLHYIITFITIGIIVTIILLVLLLVIRINQVKLKKKDDQLVYQEELFQQLSVNIDDVFMMIDAWDKTVDYISPNIERLMGIEESNVKKNIHELDSMSVSFNLREVQNKIKNMYPGEQREWDEEFVNIKSNTRRWFNINILCSTIQNRKKFIIVLSDRTKDKQVNQVLLEAVKAAESANKAKSTFLRSLSRDIRTPMNTIIGFATLAGTHIKDEEKVKDYLAKILNSGNHMLSLINEVLDIGCAENEEIHLNESKVNLFELVADLESIIGGQIRARQLQFSIESMDITDANVYCDRIRLQQVLLNLLSNAINFSHLGGIVSLGISQLNSSAKESGYYEIRVKDNGIGMNPDFVERMFMPFEREQNVETSKIHGEGLGMSVVKNIIDAMGGTIDVQTEKGKGTQFIIHLELCIASDSDGQPDSRQNTKKCNDAVKQKSEGDILYINSQRKKYQGKRLLLVEDDEYNCEIAVEILKEYGFEIDIAQNGQDAVNKVLLSVQDAYAVIIMDIRMPVMDGMEATRRIRSMKNEKLASIPIIAMTANAFIDDKRAAYASGMNGFIAKPIMVEELIRELDRAAI